MKKIQISFETYQQILNHRPKSHINFKFTDLTQFHQFNFIGEGTYNKAFSVELFSESLFSSVKYVLKIQKLLPGFQDSPKRCVRLFNQLNSNAIEQGLLNKAKLVELEILSPCPYKDITLSAWISPFIEFTEIKFLNFKSTEDLIKANNYFFHKDGRMLLDAISQNNIVFLEKENTPAVLDPGLAITLDQKMHPSEHQKETSGQRRLSISSLDAIGSENFFKYVTNNFEKELSTFEKDCQEAIMQNPRSTLAYPNSIIVQMKVRQEKFIYDNCKQINKNITEKYAPLHTNIAPELKSFLNLSQFMLHIKFLNKTLVQLYFDIIRLKKEKNRLQKDTIRLDMDLNQLLYLDTDLKEFVSLEKLDELTKDLTLRQQENMDKFSQAIHLLSKDSFAKLIYCRKKLTLLIQSVESHLQNFKEFVSKRDMSLSTLEEIVDKLFFFIHKQISQTQHILLEPSIKNELFLDHEKNFQFAQLLLYQQSEYFIEHMNELYDKFYQNKDRYQDLDGFHEEAHKKTENTHFLSFSPQQNTSLFFSTEEDQLQAKRQKIAPKSPLQ